LEEQPHINCGQEGVLNPPGRPMIFLHSSFRVSSTWLWSRFRRADGVVAYYEVFNEALASLTRGQLNSVRHDAWRSKHPVDAGYFLEFLPLLKNEGGVDKFDAAMSFARFIPAEGTRGEISASEQAYLAGLIAHAEGLGRTPVLSATRSLGRLPGISRAFPGLHILIYRNLFQQWCSYSEQCFLNNNYFFETIRRTVEENQHDQLFRYLSDLFPLGDPAIDNTNYFYCFTLLHLHIYAQVADAADLIVDMNRLSSEAEYRRAIEQQINDRSGISVDLSGARSSIAFSFAPLGKPEELVSQLKAIADLVISTAPSPQGQALATKALAELVEEYKRYRFYAGQLALAAGTGGLLGERNRLHLERDGIAAERDGLREERDRLREERDQLLAERNRLAAERIGLQLEHDTLLVEQNGLLLDREILRAERDALIAERDRIRAERDALLTERAALLKSTSWRVTAPIRTIRTLYRPRTLPVPTYVQPAAH
jgi:hypothetical protein